MPYVEPEHKEEIDAGRKPCSVGELNYAITALCNGYLDQYAGTPGYAQYNEIVGVLESAKLEFYRRAVVPYEDAKIEQNGDVYTSR